MSKKKKIKPPKKREFKKESFKKALKNFKKSFKKESFKRNPLKREFHKKLSKRTHNSNTRYRACGI
ncbi:hypothetical protein ACM32_04565 [Helicobacter pylori]|nr:hypothetical protein ACM32_04565 [Helicobacter pylori]